MDYFEKAIRDIVRDEIAAVHSQPGDPVLVRVDELANTSTLPISREKIYELAGEYQTNGFPAVWLGPKSLFIDLTKLKQWIATGGLGVKV